MCNGTILKNGIPCPYENENGECQKPDDVVCHEKGGV